MLIDAAIEPAKRGAYTNVYVRIENGGSKTVTLKSVETKLGERGAFDIHARSGSFHSDSFSFGPGEQVSFGDSGFRLIVGRLQRDLIEGLAATFFICRSWGFTRRAVSTSAIVTFATLPFSSAAGWLGFRSMR